MIDEIADLWKMGEEDSARYMLRIYQNKLPHKVYKYLYGKLDIQPDDDEIPELLLQAQQMMGGKIFDQYGMEMHHPGLRKEKKKIEFGKY